MPGVYLVALGGVGGKIVKSMYDLGIRPPPTVLQKIGVRGEDGKRRLMPGLEVQIIDMAYEREIHEHLKSEYGLVEGDQIRILIFPEEEYESDKILMNSQLVGYNNIPRYWLTVRDAIGSLGPRQGVKRYRPLSRYFVSLAASVIRGEIREDYEIDFSPSGKPDGNLFVASAGGGFGSGSLLTIASLAKQEAGEDVKNVLFLHIPLGSRYRLPITDIPFGINRAYSSVGMALLELMYVYEKHVEGEDYEDGLTEYITSQLGLREEARFKLKPFDTIVLSGLANIPRAAGIEEEFERHDTDFATIILSAISGYVTRGKDTIPIFLDNPHVNPYYTNVNQVFREKRELPPSIAYPVEVYGIRYVKLDKNEVRKNLEELMNTINYKESLEQELKDVDRQLNNKLEELKRVQDDISTLEGERARLTKFEAMDLDELLEEVIHRKEVKNRINEIERSLDDATGKIKRDVMGRVDLILRAAESGNKNWLRRVIDTANAVSNNIDNVGTTIDNIKGSLELLIEELSRLGGEAGGKPLKPEEAIAYSRIADSIAIRVVDLKSLLETVRKKLENAVDELEKRKGLTEKLPIIGGRGPASRILSRLRDLPPRLQSILGELEGYEKGLLDNKARLENFISNYKYNIESKIKELSEKASKLREEIDKLKARKADVERGLAAKGSELYSLAASFIYNVVSMLAEVGAIHGDPHNLSNRIVAEIISDEGKLKSLREMLASEELRRKFESIEGSIEMLSKISSIVGDQVRNDLIITLTNAIDASITLNIDPKRMFIRAFNIDDRGLENLIDVKGYYIVYTVDNEGLAKSIGNRLTQQGLQGRVDLVDVVSEKSSFIGVIVKRLNIPLILIREVREALKYALEKRRKVVYECKDSGGMILSESRLARCEDVVEEYDGLQFATLDVKSEDFNDFLERVKKALDTYEAAAARGD